MKISDALLPEFDQEMASTRKTLERMPEDKFDWRPHPKSFTMIALGTHIANMTAWTANVIANDSFDVAPPRCAALQGRARRFEEGIAGAL